MSGQNRTRRIALLSDVHGNLPALEAVLRDVSHHVVDEIWNLGDFLGYAPFPNEVVARLRAVKAINVIGNYDLKVLGFSDTRDTWKHTKVPEKYAAFQWNHEHLWDQTRAFLQSLPEQVKREINGLRTLLVHGSPAGIEEHIELDTSEPRLEQLAEMAQVDLIVCGHSHEALVRRATGTWFVNPGSVGRPEGGDWRASYAILEVAGASLNVYHRRVVYDIDRVARSVRDAGLPESFVEVFLKAQSLDQLSKATVTRGTSSQSPAIDSDEVLDAVLALARECDYEQEHADQVTQLSLEIFDGLAALHGMGPQERLLLEYGSLLHDIGWVEGQQGHHKVSLRRIMAEPGLPLRLREREFIGLIARYHRKALPDERHEYFRELGPEDQCRVRVLAGILRVADGLDCRHQSVIQGVRCEVSASEITLLCEARGPADDELEAAKGKSDLLSSVFGRRCAVQVFAKTG